MIHGLELTKYTLTGELFKLSNEQPDQVSEGQTGERTSATPEDVPPVKIPSG
ncbi:hypothetical protein GCM10027299_12950 [Larkinella ripae]